MRDIKFELVAKNMSGDILREQYTLDQLMGFEESFSVDIIAKRQYTSLNDKNGKEIYEGDILSIDGEPVASVTFEDGAFNLIADRSTGRSVLLQERTKRMEVIGNIYENPELLD